MNAAWKLIIRFRGPSGSGWTMIWTNSVIRGATINIKYWESSSTKYGVMVRSFTQLHWENKPSKIKCIQRSKKTKKTQQHEPRKLPEIRLRLHKQQARAVRCFVFQWDLQRTKQIKYQKTFSIAKKKKKTPVTLALNSSTEKHQNNICFFLAGLLSLSSTVYTWMTNTNPSHWSKNYTSGGREKTIKEECGRKGCGKVRLVGGWWRGDPRVHKL